MTDKGKSRLERDINRLMVRKGETPVDVRVRSIPALAPVQARRLISEFEKAVDAKSFMGGQHPEDWPGIEAGYEKAKKALLKALTGLE